MRLGWRYNSLFDKCFQCVAWDLLIESVPTRDELSEQRDRNQCEFAKASVKFANVSEEQETEEEKEEFGWIRKTKSLHRASG